MKNGHICHSWTAFRYYLESSNEPSLYASSDSLVGMMNIHRSGRHGPESCHELLLHASLDYPLMYTSKDISRTWISFPFLHQALNLPYCPCDIQTATDKWYQKMLWSYYKTHLNFWRQIQMLLYLISDMLERTQRRRWSEWCATSWSGCRSSTSIRQAQILSICLKIFMNLTNFE